MLSDMRIIALGKHRIQDNTRNNCQIPEGQFNVIGFLSNSMHFRYAFKHILVRKGLETSLSCHKRSKTQKKLRIPALSQD